MAYLKDALAWELVTMKKSHEFSRRSINPNIKNSIEKAGRMHERHYQILLKHLDPNKFNQQSFH